MVHNPEPCNPARVLLEAAGLSEEDTLGIATDAGIRTTVFHDGPYKTIADVEYATAGWVDWYNNRRLHYRSPGFETSILRRSSSVLSDKSWLQLSLLRTSELGRRRCRAEAGKARPMPTLPGRS